MKKQYQTLFGPVPSRRFGRSLGIDLTPLKTCSHNCIYCQLGETTNLTVQQDEYVDTALVIAELEEWLHSGVHADYLTLSGSGEPTLHSRFGDILEWINAHTEIPSVLLTNGSLFDQPGVQQNARHASIVKITLSAWDQISYEHIHRPAMGLHFESIIAGQQKFQHGYDGQVWLEVMVLRGINDSVKAVNRIKRIVQTLQADEVQLNTVVRPPADFAAQPVPRETMKKLAAVIGGKVIGVFRERKPDSRVGWKGILNLLERRPCTAEDLIGAYGMHPNELSKYLGALIAEGKISTVREGNKVYYKKKAEVLPPPD